LIKELVVSIY